IKTGTTSLQQFLFCAHPQLHAFGHPHQSPLDTRLSGALRAIDGFGDEPQVLGAAVADAVAAWPVGRVPLLSDETLTADPRLAAAAPRRPRSSASPVRARRGLAPPAAARRVPRPLPRRAPGAPPRPPALPPPPRRRPGHPGGRPRRPPPTLVASF